MSVMEFGIPCFALAHREAADPLEAARSVVISEFGNMGRCVLLFRDRQTAEATARALGHDAVVEVGNPAFLMLVLDAAARMGCVRIAVDYVRTLDGQACHFHDLNKVIGLIRPLAG
jgi:hypothetical protein